MTVYFIGAGPGAVDLITMRGYHLLKKCQLVLYAGSLVPIELLAYIPAATKKFDTAPLTLPEIIKHMKTAHDSGFDVARLHSGDPSLYGAIGEQMVALKKLQIPFEIVPGVSSFSAAAAVLQTELTLPQISQSVILTRVEGNASEMPPHETIQTLAASRATMVFYLSIRRLRQIVRELIPFYGEDCPVAVCYRVSWPDQMIIRGCLKDIVGQLKPFAITRTALIMVGRCLSAELIENSHLYDPAHTHIFRPVVKSND